MYPTQRVWLTLALLSAILIHPTSRALAYDSDKVYEYKFDGVVSSRVPNDESRSNQQAGVALSSSLLLRQISPDELLVKLDKPRIATFNEIVEQPGAQKFNYKPIDEASLLDKPFKVYLDSETGATTGLDLYKGEPKWASNLKRGIASLFQLKLKTSDTKSSEAQYFTVNERSVNGDCDTDYLVMPNETFSFNVSKSRDISGCNGRFVYRFMPIDTSEKGDSEGNRIFKNSNALLNYYLTGTPKNYEIQEVTVDEVATFSPFGLKGRLNQIESKLRLELDQISGHTNSLKWPESGAERNDELAYDQPEKPNFYASVNLDEPHYMINMGHVQATAEQAANYFDDLVQEHRQYTEAFDSKDSNEGNSKFMERSKLAQLFVDLKSIVATMSTQNLEQLYSTLDAKGELHKKAFWDIMSVVGTNPSIMFMKKLITEGDAPSVKIKDFLLHLSYHVKFPTKSLFDEYVNLCKSEKISSKKDYKRLCLLPLASLIRQHCVKPNAMSMHNHDSHSKASPNTCQLSTAEEYFTKLVPSVSTSSANDQDISLGDKMFAIKMAGELGVKPSIEFLTKFIQNKQEHPTIREAAMSHLLRVASLHPILVKQIIAPYYYDPKEALGVRAAAFRVWFFTGMELHELDTLTKQLKTEPNRQLVLYIQSAIKGFAQETKYPCTFQKPASMVLDTVKKASQNLGSPSVFDSRMTVWHNWVSDYHSGTMNVLSMVKSNESFAPSYLSYSVTEVMSGLRFQQMEVTLQGHGLDKLIKRVIGINGLLSDKESFMDVFSLKRRTKRQVNSIKDEIKSIENELKLATREFSDVYLAITISMYGRPVTFFDIDSKELKKMLSEDGTVKVPQIKKLLHSFNNYTRQQMMVNFEMMELYSNELGLPIFRSMDDFEYKTLKLNNVKIDVEPGFFKDERNGKPPSRLAAAIDSKMARHNEILVASGVLVAHEKKTLGVGFHKKKILNIPLKMSIDANLLENKLTIKRQPIHENLLFIRQTPISFSRSFDPTIRAEDMASDPSNWRPLYDFRSKNQMKDFKLDYMTPLAIGLKAEGKHPAGQDWSMAAWRRYLNQVGWNTAKFSYFYSPSGSPLELRLSTVTTNENPTRELTSQISWNHYSKNPNEQLSEVDKELEKFTSMGSKPRSGEATKPTTVAYRVALLGGSSKERKVSVDINYSRSFDRLLHKWRLFYQRTPLEQSAPNSEVTNLCWLGSMRFPYHPVEKLLKFDLLDLENTANLTSELTFGDECNEKGSSSSDLPHVSAQVNFDWSEDQRKMIQTVLGKRDDGDEDSLRKNVYLSMYNRCMKARETSNAQLHASCVHLLFKMNELTHIKAQLEYKDVPERWTKLAKRVGALYTYARAGYIDQIEDAPQTSRNFKSPDGKQDLAHIEANMTLDSIDRKLSYEFDTANYRVVYSNVPISVPPLSTFSLFDDGSYYQMLQKSSRNRFCSVSGQTVTTFDNSTFLMPSVGTGCLSLLAKDCSPEGNFMVLSAPKGSSGKELRVYVGQKYRVDFIPSENGEKVSEVKINGESVTVDAEAAPVKREVKFGPVTKEAFSINYNGAFHTLDSKTYRFSVSTNGNWIFVREAKYYAGKSCGLCGDANGDQLREFKPPYSAEKICKTNNDFVWSYAIPSSCPNRPTSIECYA